MNPNTRKRFMRQTMLTLWSMITLVLLFTVVLLARELIRQGHNPLAIAETSAERGAAQRRAAPAGQGTREVQLYFASEDGRFLVPEVRRFELSGPTQDNCRHILQALVEGPRQALTPILPPTTRIRALYLLSGGELVVDFSQELKTDETRPRSLSAESLMIYGIANTLALNNVQGSDGQAVRTVRFLFEGSDWNDSFHEHLDLSRPIGPNTRWVMMTQDHRAAL
jgi:hypothetical protein